MVAVMYGYAQPKKIGALKINTAIKIDGALDELIWAQSDSAINFIQISPQLVLLHPIIVGFLFCTTIRPFM